MDIIPGWYYSGGGGISGVVALDALVKEVSRKAPLKKVLYLMGGKWWTASMDSGSKQRESLTVKGE